MSPSSSIREAQAELVRDRVLGAACDLIEAGEELTFTRVARTAAVPERTVYRHFANRQALIGALFEHVNQQIGFDGALPTTPAETTAMVQRVFPGFDLVAPVVDELLSSPEGRRARLDGVDDRRAAAEAVVRSARPDLDEPSTRDVAAVVQVLASAAVWRALRDFWDFDGERAAGAVTTAIDALLTPPITSPLTEPKA